MALRAPSILVCRRCAGPVLLRLRPSSGLVAVVGILLLVALFFLFSKLLPGFLDVFTLMLPLITNDLGNFRVGEFWVVRGNL